MAALTATRKNARGFVIPRESQKTHRRRTSVAVSMRLLASVGALVSSMGMAACGGGSDATSPSPVLNPAETYWALQFNQHTVTLALTAPNNTIRLTATPLNIAGQPISGLGLVRYSTRDSAITVDSTGLVTAKFATPTILAAVAASLTDTVHHLTLYDTCFVNVTTTAPLAPLTNFTIHSSATDTLPLGTQVYTMTVTATDVQGNPIAVVPYFASSDSSIARIDKTLGNVTSVRVGQVMLYATTWAYGVAKRDSLAFTIGQPVIAVVNALSQTPTGSTHPTLTFWPQIITVSAGAVVKWVNQSFTDSLDVTFDDPTHVDSVLVPGKDFGSGQGNIDPFVRDTMGSSEFSRRYCLSFGLTPPNCGDLDAVGLPFIRERWRKFPVVGTYHYHSRKWSSTGTIVVQP